MNLRKLLYVKPDKKDPPKIYCKFVWGQSYNLSSDYEIKSMSKEAKRYIEIYGHSDTNLFEMDEIITGIYICDANNTMDSKKLILIENIDKLALVSKDNFEKGII